MAFANKQQQLGRIAIKLPPIRSLQLEAQQEDETYWLLLPNFRRAGSSTATEAGSHTEVAVVIQKLFS